MFAILLESALRALLLALLVGGGLTLFQIQNVVTQKLAWALVLLAAFAMPLARRSPIEVRLPAPAALRAHLLPHSTPIAPQAATATAPAAVLSDNFNVAPKPAEPLPAAQPQTAPARRNAAPAAEALKFETPAPAAAGSGPNAAAQTTLHTRAFPWLGAALAVYFAGLAVLVLRLALGLVRSFGLWRRAEPIDTARLALDLPPSLCRQLRSSPAVPSPATVAQGVLLPADYPDWEPQKLRVVLAHELSHLRQGDFFLQLLAGLHAAIFWFSPLGWWLRRKLSDLSETISDRAGLSAAADAPSYAQTLLEFAALPRPTFTGVPMARRSNLSRRIERLLNESSFHRAFAGSRARRLIALVLVPLALVAATAAVRVQASDQNLLAAQPAAAPAAPTAPAAAAEPADPSEPAESAEPDESATSPEDTADSSSATLIQESANNNGITVKNGAHMYLNSDGDSWALVPSKPGAITFSGTYSHITQKQLDHAREQAHGPLLWIMHGGKSYFVTDPSILREFQSSMDRMEVLGGMQNVLGKQQEALGKQQEALAQAQEARGKIVVPDLSKEKAEIDRAMSELEKHKGEALSQEDLAGMQQRLADMQGRLGQLQGKMGAQMGQLGSQMGKLGAMQGTLGARQGKIGSEQGRIGKGINSRVQSEIGEWIREGKARPIE